MVESKAEKENRKRGTGLIDFKERKVGRVTTTQKNSGTRLYDETEFEKYRVIQDRLFMSDFDKYMLELEENTKK